MQQAIALYVGRAAAKLRRQHQVATGMIIFAHTSRFIESPRASSIVVTLPTGTNFTPELLKHATTALRQIYEPHCPYKKAGVIMTGLHSENERQGVLLEPPKDLDRELRLSQIVDSFACAKGDRLNHRYGAETLSFGLVGQQQPWRIRCNQRSPRFTTRWDELPRGQAGFGTMEAGNLRPNFLGDQHVRTIFSIN